MKPDYFSVGLTGGVGSGKSTVAAMLQQQGAGIVDADALAHELTRAGGDAIASVCDRFGPEAIAADGSLDRAWMRARVFGDSTIRRSLEDLLHPLIRRLAHERGTALAASGRPYIVFVIPLLAESGDWRTRVNRVLLVDCSEATQILRVRARPGLDEPAARSIISAQASRSARLAIADDVLFNEAPPAEIGPRVLRLHEAYMKLAEGVCAETL